jgi:hypothetical protein
MPSEQKQLQRKINKKVLNEYVDFETKKSVHINLKKRTHAEFRKALLDLDLSMQEVFENFARLLILEDKRALSIVKEIKSEKRLQILKNIDNIESDNIYDAISEIDPFS